MDMAKLRFNDYSRSVNNTLDTAIKEALKNAGSFVEGEAKLRSPVDTGKLRDSINNRLQGDNRVDIGTDVEYAIYVEKGTSKQVAQPYLTPSAEENINKIKRIIASTVSRYIGGGR